MEPLSYDSLKTVLQHIEANMRFRLSSQIPSIQSAERSTPLKINNLDFYNMKTNINNTRYQLGIYRKLHNDFVSKSIMIQNEVGGVYCDVDQFGFEDYSGQYVMLPGDVSDLREDEDEDEIDEIGNMKALEMSIKEKENELAILLEHEDVESPIVMRHEIALDRDRNSFITYHCRRNNIRPPYDYYIQLTVTTPNEKRIERVMYEKKLYEAMKYLNHSLFGQRRHTVQVKCLDFLYLPYNFTICLPVGLKLKIGKIKSYIGHLASLVETFRPIIEDSSFPLHTLDVIHIPEDFSLYQNSIIENAKKLIIRNCNLESYISVLLKLTNEKVHLQNVDTFTVEDCILLIKNWFETNRKIGTCFQFTTYDETVFPEFLDEIKQRFSSAINKEKSVILAMNNFLELHVSYDDFPSTFKGGPNSKKWGMEWGLKTQLAYINRLCKTTLAAE